MGRRLSSAVIAVLTAMTLTLLGPAVGDCKSLDSLEREIRELRQQNERNQQQIKELERTVGELKSQPAQPAAATPAGAAPAEAQAKSEDLRPDLVRRALDRYLGEHRFMIAGYGFAQYHWDDNANHNTFSGGFNPIFLFRLNDRLLFSAELEVKLPEDAETEVNLEFAQADYLVNDYLTVAAGKFLLPFGDFIEHLHPPWINKLVTPPLPFREGDEGGILPFTELGVQARGGVPLGYADDADFDYTVYAGNGPRYDGDGTVGDPFVTNNDDINRTKGFGARIGVRPLPPEWNAGRFRLGASTYDGSWDSSGGQWLTTWGLDSVYQYRGAELRGEYLSTHRQLAGKSADDREGWYIQGSYALAEVVPDPWSRFEFVARYTGQNQRQAPEGQLPHPRQVSLGLDYWITPSVVWKLEYDRDIPRDASDNNEIFSELAVGF
jgi:hypothetical protein